jgi:CRISPR/Cas system-associated endonuclease Cas1
MKLLANENLSLVFLSFAGLYLGVWASGTTLVGLAYRLDQTNTNNTHSLFSRLI